VVETCSSERQRHRRGPDGSVSVADFSGVPHVEVGLDGRRRNEAIGR